MSVFPAKYALRMHEVPANNDGVYDIDDSKKQILFLHRRRVDVTFIFDNWILKFAICMVIAAASQGIVNLIGLSSLLQNIAFIVVSTLSVLYVTLRYITVNHFCLFKNIESPLYMYSMEYINNVDSKSVQMMLAMLVENNKFDHDLLPIDSKHDTFIKNNILADSPMQSEADEMGMLENDKHMDKIFAAYRTKLMYDNGGTQTLG